MDRKRNPSLFVWTFSNAPLLGFLILVIFTLLIVILSFQYSLRTEISSLEERLRYIPPENEHQEIPYDDSESTKHRAYIPAYSHIYHEEGNPILLAVTLSIRNIDPSNSINISSVRYYDTNGNMVKEYLKSPKVLKPLRTIEYLVERKNIEGGSGANFIVEWSADNQINQPIIETVMVGSNGISFVCSGQEIYSSTP